MSGRPKQGLDAALWSVHIFDNDAKIDKLIDSKDWAGFGVYFWLCQRALGTNGYFFEWSYDDCASTARKMGGGVNSGTVKETVSYCFRIDLFNKRLFDRWGVLTSRGIQRSFLPVLLKRRVKKVYEEYWLLSSDESKGLVKVSLNDDVQPTNDDVQPTNDDVQSIKESKVKESNIKEYMGAFSDQSLESAFQFYLVVRNQNWGEISEEQIQAMREELISMSDDAKEQIAIVKKATAGGWKNFYPIKKGRKKKEPVKKAADGGYIERDYDMDSLEVQLLKAQEGAGVGHADQESRPGKVV